MFKWGSIEDRGILFTADVGAQGLNEAADYGQKNGVLAPQSFVQVPTTESGHNVSRIALDRWLGGLLPEGPRARVLLGRQWDGTEKYRVKWKNLNRWSNPRRGD